MQMSEKIDLLAPALVKAQSELSHAIKDSSSEAFKRNGKAMKYADLTAVWTAAKPVLKANDLCAVQDAVNTDVGLGVRTRLIHKSGQWIEFDPPIIPLSKRDAHGAGSALTYGRRYSLSAALGVVADEDDDGNAAVAGNGNGVADAHPITSDPTKIKNAPGVSEAKVWVREHIRELNGCENADQFLEMIGAVKARWTRICAVYPNVWTGPDGSGLRGSGMTVAQILECRPQYDEFVKAVELSAKEVQQPQAAE